MERELSSNSVLIRDYPGHESLWCYRRFVFQSFLVMTPPEDLLPIFRRTTGRCYDWPAWNRAVRDAYERYTEEDARQSEVEAHEVEQEDDEDGSADDCYDCGDAEGGVDEGNVVDDEGWEAGEQGVEKGKGVLPGAPTGGGTLEAFLRREVLFSLLCATDKVSYLLHAISVSILCVLRFGTVVCPEAVGTVSAVPVGRSLSKPPMITSIRQPSKLFKATGSNI